MEQLGAYRPGGFRYPKFHANRKYPELIRRTGCVGLASAGYGEATHKLIKQAYQLSNKKSAGLEQQVGLRKTLQHLCWSPECAIPARAVMRSASMPPPIDDVERQR